MATRADPTFLSEIKELGAVGIEKCFNCGSCTATCPLADDKHLFPRDMIRFAQLGLAQRILQSTDAWQCYYCGDCSTSCPRGAEPAETMMAIRRWLIGQYDKTGYAARLFKSNWATLFAILRSVSISLALLLLLHTFGIARLVTDRMELNTVFPVMWVWAAVLVHFCFLGARVINNMATMTRHVLKEELLANKISLFMFVSEFKNFIFHFVTQKRWRENSGNKSGWLKHLLFMSGYATMLALIVPFLWWFQTDNLYPIFHPQRWLGYYATIMLIGYSVDSLIGRIKKQEQRHRFSHLSDWMFPAMILFGAVSGILVHMFRYLGNGNITLVRPTYILYIVHVLAMVAMLDTEVGVGKWMHMMYRPLAQYLEAIKKRVEQPGEELVGVLTR
jgi:ferredoxin